MKLALMNLFIINMFKGRDIHIASLEVTILSLEKFQKVSRSNLEGNWHRPFANRPYWISGDYVQRTHQLLGTMLSLKERIVKCTYNDGGKVTLRSCLSVQDFRVLGLLLSEDSVSVKNELDSFWQFGRTQWSLPTPSLLFLVNFFQISVRWVFQSQLSKCAQVAGPSGALLFAEAESLCAGLRPFSESCRTEGLRPRQTPQDTSSFRTQQSGGHEQVFWLKRAEWHGQPGPRLAL